MQAPTLAAMLDAARGRAAALEPRRRELERRAAAAPAGPSLASALRGAAVAVIAEVKRRSPAVGVIRDELDAAAHARAYVRGGASAVSVLTDEAFFGGALADLEAVAAAVAVPVLRKDFILEELQVLEARAAGASAVLLIARALDQAGLARLCAAARAAGLETLVEVHSAAEVERALAAGATVVGVNSRDLDTFAVDLGTAERLLGGVPARLPAVAESGVGERGDVARLARAGADAVLVGTSVARAADPEAAVRALTGVARRPEVRRG